MDQDLLPGDAKSDCVIGKDWASRLHDVIQPGLTVATRRGDPPEWPGCAAVLERLDEVPVVAIGSGGAVDDEDLGAADEQGLVLDGYGVDGRQAADPNAAIDDHLGHRVATQPAGSQADAVVETCLVLVHEPAARRRLIPSTCEDPTPIPDDAASRAIDRDDVRPTDAAQLARRGCEIR